MVDILSGQDLLEEDTFGYLAGLAAEGRTEGVMGGPPCRTYSYCRHFEPGPYWVRGRGEEWFGYEELSDVEARKVEGDSVLMLRMWILAVLANGGRELVGRKAWMVKEHPKDPRSFVSEEEWEKAKARGGEPPSIWDWPEVAAMEEVLGLIRVKFDQAAMGHIKRKPTMLLTSIKDLRQLDGMRGPGGDRESSSWAEWAQGLVAALDEAIKGRWWRRQEWQRHRRRRCGRATSRMAIPRFAETAGPASKGGSEEGAIGRGVTRPWPLWQST